MAIFGVSRISISTLLCVTTVPLPNQPPAMPRFLRSRTSRSRMKPAMTSVSPSAHARQHLRFRDCRRLHDRRHVEHDGAVGADLRRHADGERVGADDCRLVVDGHERRRRDDRRLALRRKCVHESREIHDAAGSAQRPAARAGNAGRIRISVYDRFGNSARLRAIACNASG